MPKPTTEQIQAMHQPVRCNRCYTGIYDLGTVTVTARYADCSVWRTPCCDQSVDDRGHTGWTNRKDYEHIDKNAPHARPDVHGHWVR
jgi:hypothetical protein